MVRYDTAKTQLDVLKREKLERVVRKEKLFRFLDTLRKTDTAPDIFNECLFRDVVETMKIHSLEDIAVKFYSGTEIRI